MIYTMFYCDPCNCDTQYLIKPNYVRNMQHAHLKAVLYSAYFAAVLCLTLADASRPDQRLPNSTDCQQMNSTKVLPLLCFIRIYPFCIRFHFSGTRLSSRPERRSSCFMIFLSFCMQMPVYYWDHSCFLLLSTRRNNDLSTVAGNVSVTQVLMCVLGPG
jgi:hypothetical protein